MVRGQNNGRDRGIAGSRSPNATFGSYYFKFSNGNGESEFAYITDNNLVLNSKFPHMLNRWMIYVGRFTGDETQQFVNGYWISRSGVFGQAYYLSVNESAIGATFYNSNLADYFWGDIAEFAVYSSVLPIDQICRITNFLKQKYGL